MDEQQDKPITVGYLKNQGIVAMDAVSQFMSGYVEELRRPELNLVAVRDIDMAVIKMRNGDMDYLVMRKESNERMGEQEFPCDSVWSMSFPLSYVVAAPYSSELLDVTALLLDQFAEEHTAKSLPSVMDGLRYFRYGCKDGDIGARRLKQQPNAYMHGTAIVCSPRACAASGLRRLTEPFVDDDNDSVEFVAVACKRENA